MHLREWGTRNVHRLPRAEPFSYLIGADPAADLRIVDPRGLVSRRHARVIREDNEWVIEDLHSRNGVRCDGVRSRRFSILPGTEIGIGGLTFIAENDAIVRLREYLARVLGWEAGTWSAIDVALRAIRAAAYRRGALVLAGADDLVAVARQIHLRTTASNAPFVVCGKRVRPKEPDGGVGVTATLTDGLAALARAAGGTVCVRTRELPVRYDELVEATSDALAVGQLYLCAKKARKGFDQVTSPILVPKLARRSVADLRRIIYEYALDAIRELRAHPTAFTEVEREWVLKHEVDSFAQIEIATRRLVAFKDGGTVSQAATRLSLSHTAVGNWLKRRKLLKK